MPSTFLRAFLIENTLSHFSTADWDGKSCTELQCSPFRNPSETSPVPSAWPWPLLTSVRQVYALSDPKCPCVCLVTWSCPTLCDPMDCSLPGASVHEDSPDKNTGVGCQALLQGIFPTRGWTQVSWIAGRFFIVWATREALASIVLRLRQPVLH